MPSLESALSLIRKAREEQSPFLDLGNCGLTEFPKEVFELQELEELNLSRVCCLDGKKWQPSQNNGKDNVFRTIPRELGQLKKLRKISLYQCSVENIEGLQCLCDLENLNLDNNKIEDISSIRDLKGLRILSLANNEISDISALGNLSNLTILNVSNNRIADLSSLAKLIHLEKLDVWNNEVRDISSLRELINLKSLSLSDNEIEEIEALSVLMNLQCLSIAGNSVQHIGPILNLHFLEYLSLANNKIEVFSEVEFNCFPYLKQLFLFNNPIKDIPKEHLGVNAFENCISKILEIYQPIKVFISYSREDIESKNELLGHLSSLRRLNKITIWEDGQILAGQNWEPEIYERLHNANLVLCLISKNFINSDFCYSQELKKAIEAHNERSKVVIPIIIKPCYWEKLYFAKIQSIPKKPVSVYDNKDAGWTEVVKKIDESVVYAKKIRYGSARSIKRH